MRRDLKQAAEKIVAKTKNFAEAAAELADKLAADKVLRFAAAMTIVEQLPKRASKRKELPSRRRVGPHRKPTGMPTAAQKTGAMQAEQSYAATIFDRKLRGGRKVGDVRMHEIRAIATQAAQNFGKFINRGFEDGVEMMGLSMLAKHAVASDPYSKVRDVIKPALAEKIFKQAEIATAQWLAEESSGLANRLIQVAERQELPAS
jgi:hypothetical protein